MNVREFEVDDDCFENMDEVKLIGWKKLRSLLFGC